MAGNSRGGTPSGQILYGFVRSRELEGTLDQPPMLGIWTITSNRVWKGYGWINDADWPAEQRDPFWPPRIPPHLDQKAKANRLAMYQRAVTLADCKSIIDRGLPVASSFEITDSWSDPPKGII